MTDVEFRRATVDDADGIARVHVETWQFAYRGIVAQQHLDAMSIKRQADRWREWFARFADDTVDVATVDAEIRGFINAGSSRDPDAVATVGEVRAIYVHPSAWDMGAGRGLMQRGLDALRARYTEATLWVLEANERARRFYELGGWSADGTSQPLESLDNLIEVRYRIDL